MTKQSTEDQAAQTLESGIEEIDEQAAAVHERYAEACEVAKRERDEALADLKGRRRRLVAALRRLGGEANGRVSKRAEAAREAGRLALDPHVQAGPENVKKVEAYLRRHGKAFQSKLTTDVKLHSGTVSWALKALAADGKIRATGKRRRSSAEFEYVGTGRRARGARRTSTGGKLERVK